MKKLLILLFALPFSVMAQVTLDWQQFTGGVSITTDAADNVYTIAWDYNPAGDIYLTKRDASGNFLWTTSYDNTDNTRHEVATWVETDNENNIIVTGTSRSGFASPVDAASLVMKFGPAGNLIWRVVYETAFDGSHTTKCLVDSENNIYVLGLGTGPGGMVTKVKKFAPDGTALWAYYNNAGIGAPMNFKFTPDNNILIIGRGTVGSVNGYAKIDKNGNELWSYAGVNSLTIGDAAGDATGNTYLINGEWIVVGVQGSILTKLSPTGSVILNSTNDITATKVEVGNDNLPIVAGFPTSGSSGLAMIKYQTDGTILWQNLDADGPSYNLLLHNIMKLDVANNAYFSAGTLFQQAVCKVNADGTSGWLALASSGYNNDFDFGNDYSIYMVGGLSTAHFTQAPVITCNTPGGLFSNNITTTKARLNWTVVPDAVQYEIWYKKTTAINWKKKFVPGINNKLTLKNLTCNTNYVWKIRTVCDTVGVDLVSDFSADQYFTTSLCRESDDINNEGNVNIFPNPATDLISIELPEAGDWVISIADLSGRVILSQVIDQSSVAISTDQVPNGMYFVICTKGTERLIEKIIISK